jgi:hypothetical protein
MTEADHDLADARSNSTVNSQNDTMTSKDENSSKAMRDAAAKAVIDNMARLKALRLAKEAAEPARSAPAAKKARGKATKKSAEKTPALADWLAGQQSGGRRT